MFIIIKYLFGHAASVCNKRVKSAFPQSFWEQLESLHQSHKHCGNGHSHKPCRNSILWQIMPAAQLWWCENQTCGYSNPLTTRFCGHCGMARPAPRPMGYRKRPAGSWGSSWALVFCNFWNIVPKGGGIYLLPPHQLSPNFLYGDFWFLRHNKCSLIRTSPSIALPKNSSKTTSFFLYKSVYHN